MMVPLGMDGIWQPYSWLMVPKEGSKIWARSIDGKENPPFLISWQYGEGETWSDNLGMTYEWWFLTDPRMGGNPFALDVFMNMLYHSARMDLPDDILVIHAARKALEDYGDTKSSLLALVEFADRFGANTNLIYDELNDADEIKERGRGVYLEQRYEESLTILGEAREFLGAAAEHTIQLKNRVLVWTYAIEWLVVLGTLIISGETLYSFMVKRKLHHEVPRTRLARL